MNTWKQDEEILRRGYPERLDAMTPEPLFESIHMPQPHICLCCGHKWATTVLITPIGMRAVVPICESCSIRWNFYGYYALKKIRPKKVLWQLLKFKARNLWRHPSFVDIYNDVKSMIRWSRKMSRMKL